MSRLYPHLPRRVQPKGLWFYLVVAEGEKRVWKKLTKIRDGLPALFRKLADEYAREVAPDLVPMIAADWMKEVSPTRSDKNDQWVMDTISEGLAEFRAREVTTPACLKFLSRWDKRPADWDDATMGVWKRQPRTYNLMRSGLMELMRYAEGKETDGVPFRDPGTNPVPSIKRQATPARDRYPTDSEVRRIKFAAMVGRPDRWGRRGLNPSGPMVAALIDLAYLTGQRIGDLLNLRWNKKAATDSEGNVSAPYVAEEGIFFKPSKTAGSTGAKVLITWTPRLRGVLERIEKHKGRSLQGHVATNQDGRPLVYSTFATAYWRACDRAGIKGLHFHDLKAKALTDTAKLHGKKAAQTKGAHSTERQTEDYLRRMEAQKSEATR
jgi:integrase